MLLELDAGRTTGGVHERRRGWFATARHPRFGVRSRDLTYAPMLELLEFAARAAASTSSSSPAAASSSCARVGEELYGVGPDDVVGSAVEVGVRAARRAASCSSARRRCSARPTRARRRRSTSRPTSAAARSWRPATAPATREMLEYAHTGEHPSLCLVVDHDDEEREYAYAGVSGDQPRRRADRRHRPSRLGWTVVSMRRDWSRVFAG